MPGNDAALSALPGRGARVIAFASIVATGAGGGLIGYGTVDVQCTGECGVPLGTGILLGSTMFAGGAAVVAVLVLRAVGEWRNMGDTR